MCILTYAVNFLLVFLSWLVFRRFENETLFDGLKNDIRKYSNNMKFTSSFVIACVIIFIGVPMVFPAYWNMGINTSFRDVPTGITEDGHPWIGSEDPQVTIIEYSDYQCFQCKKMHLFLRQLIVEYPESIRLVHLHFPMDHAFNPIVKEPFHVGSGKLALLAIFSEIRGKFWEMNDTLFNLGNVTDTIKIGEISDLTGLNAKELAASIDNAYIKKRLKIDIWDGIRRGVTGTPSYIINGQLYLGELPSHVFSKIQ